MNRVVIVLVSVDFENAKEICQQKNDLDFGTTKEIIEAFSKDLIRDEDFIDDTTSIMAVSLDEFVSMCNSQSISIENYFISKVSKRIDETSLEIFDDWLKQVEFEAKMFGDLANVNSIIIELADDVAYQIGYDEDSDSFYFNNLSDDEISSIDYSEDFEKLYVWEKQMKQIIEDFKK